MVCCCAATEGQAILCIGDPETRDLRQANGIIIDTTGPVEITNTKEAYALSAWMSAAAVWLRSQEIAEGGK